MHVETYAKILTIIRHRVVDEASPLTGLTVKL